jgi:sucrose phosphorylase
VADVAADRDSHAPGLLRQEAIDSLIETIHLRSRDESRLATGGAARNVDTSQINCTFYDALGRRDAEYLVARAIQCFLPGIPQIYYVGLLAGTNDLDLLRRTGQGRDINRHYYTTAELQGALAQPIVQSLISLLRIRNIHPAFQGAFHVKSAEPTRLTLAWEKGAAFARLDVDFAEMRAAVACSADEADAAGLAWCSSPATNGVMQGESR